MFEDNFGMDNILRVSQNGIEVNEERPQSPQS
jgi:hypothetical protein